MSKVYTKKYRRQRLFPTLKTPDVDKQNHWRRKPSF